MASDKVEIAPNTNKSHNDKFITEPIVTEPHSDSGSNGQDGMHDVEKHGANRESLPLPDLKRKLKSRHLQMIAIGLSPYPLRSRTSSSFYQVAQSELVSSLVVELPSQMLALQARSSHTFLSALSSTQS
jgi:hypothetical protein